MRLPRDKDRLDEPMEVDEGPSCSGQNGDQNGINDEIGHISDDEEGGIRVGDIYIPPAPKPALTFDSTGPRLLITHIVNENFKSYAGVQSLGPFHKSFTAIIGPNGSGKSNVIDSMLFVFGYRAAKIRSKKISVLIHSSSKYPNITSATVAVHFCQIIDGEGEEFEVVPNSEIVVSRTAHKDNSSYYNLNGKRVQFKEVAKMLRSQGIDLDHNRFLILQGEVEQIAMMKPKGLSEHESGMLEYLEDIIGTSRYKEPIEKLSDKVEEYAEMRKEKLNRVRLVEQEKQKLEQPMMEAVEQMNLTNIVLRTRNMLLQKYIHETNKIVETKASELVGLKEKLGEVDGKLDRVKQEHQDKSKVYTAETQKYEILKKKRVGIIEKLQSCKRKTVSVIADVSQSNKKKKNLDQLLEVERGKLIELELIPEKNKRDIKECELLLAKHTDNKRLADEELQTVMAGVRSKTRTLQETRDVLQAQLIELKKNQDTANNSYKLAESELKLYLSNENKELEKLQRMKEAYEKATNDIQENKTLRTELATSLPSNEQLLSEQRSKMQAIQNEENNIFSEIRSLRSQLEESRQAMSANRSRGRVLDTLMNEKRNGNLPGIFGRLGDLGGIDMKYDVAISTCCGSLDNIVVDNVDTAQACVEFLRRHDVGRATFIILDKQQHLRELYERRFTYPENAPRLFDLVKVKDNRVLPAFYFALRDTLVANDLDQATRISFGSVRYRVVTLQGQLIEIAGAMSGGGKSVMRGKMSSRVQQDTNEQDPRVIQANESKLSALEERLIAVRSEQTQLEDSIVSLQQTIVESKTKLNKLDTEITNLTKQIPLIKDQIKKQEVKAASSKVDPARKANLEAVLNDAMEKLEKAKHDAGEIEKEVHVVDAKISTIAGGKVNDLQKIVDDLANKISRITSEITKLNVAINTSIRNAKKSMDKIKQMETDLKETETNIDNLNNQKKQLSLEASKLEKDADDLEDQINEGTSEFSGLKQEIVALEKQVNVLMTERLEANDAVEKSEKSIHDCRSKIPLWEKELRGLKLEDPGFEGLAGIERPAPFEQHTNEDLEAVSVDELRNRLTAQKGRLGDNKPNIKAIQDYKTKEELYLKRAAELDEITTKRNDMRALYDQIKKKRTTDFLCGFNTITAKLKEMYQMITLGGDAELELVDSLDPFSEGIIFSVRPPNKSWKNISNLSGGEKTLSSLALVFALHYYKPTPLYVMDEIDAALDFKNVSIVANYIKERTRNAQFIIISLRYNMFEVSNRLIGIYKTEDCTKSVTVENKLPEQTTDDKID